MKSPTLAFAVHPLTLAISMFLAPSTLLFADTTERNTQKDTATASATAPQINTLPTLVVEARGNWLDQANAEKVQQHAGARTILSRERMDAVGATSVKEALKFIPGVQVQDNAGTAGSDLSLSVGVRGLTSRFSPRSTVLLDGIPLAFAPYGQPQLSLAPTSLGNIENIDVIRGAGSVRFGPQNVGGIINFNTRAIPEAFQAHVGLNTEISENSRTRLNPNLFLGGQLDNGIGLALLYSGSLGYGYRSENSHNNIHDLMLKSQYQFNQQHKIEASLQRYDAKADMPGGLNVAEYQKDPAQSTRPFDYFVGDRSAGSLKYSYKDEHNAFEVLAYHTQTFRDAVMEKQNDKNAAQRQLRNAPRDYKVTAFEPRYSHSYAFGQSSNELSLGYRYLIEDSKEYIGRSPWYNTGARPLAVAGFSAADGDTTAHAVYIDHRTQFGAWTITPGLRFESIKTRENFYKLNANNSIKNKVNTEVKSNEFLPNLSVQYAFSPELNLFANYAVSFGPQQYSQMAKIDKANNAVSQVNGLSPEKATNYELGAHYRSDVLSAELTAFYIDFDQELLRLNQAGLESWTNLGATKHKGVEAGLSYDLGSLSDALEGLSFYSNLTYTKASAAAGVRKGKDLSYYSNWVGHVGAAYVYQNWRFNADSFAQSRQVAANSKGLNIEDPSGMYGPIPGFGTVSVRAAYDFQAQLSGLKAAIGVKNLFDQNYFTRSSDANGGKFMGQSRTVFLQTSYDF